MSNNNYWLKQQQLYIQVFGEALPMLQKKFKKKRKKYHNEDDISRDLYLSLHNIIYNGKYKRLKLGLPTFQAQSQPDPKKKKKEKREDKRPDFLWSYFDYVNRDRRDFYVECKRLKTEQSVYCKEYVKNGIQRFLKKDWSYGKGCDNGLMVGYVEGLAISECIEKIKEYLLADSIPTLSPYRKGSRTRSYLKHRLNRTEVSAKNFDLYHFLVKI